MEVAIDTEVLVDGGGEDVVVVVVVVVGTWS